MQKSIGNKSVHENIMMVKDKNEKKYKVNHKVAFVQGKKKVLEEESKEEFDHFEDESPEHDPQD
jgi:hypothetical protein